MKYDKNGCVVAGCTKTSSTDSVSLSPVICYPNPTTGQIHIEVRDMDSKSDMYLYDVMGRRAHRIIDLDTGMHSLNLFNLSSGLYHYKVVQKGIEVARGKVIKIE